MEMTDEKPTNLYPNLGPLKPTVPLAPLITFVARELAELARQPRAAAQANLYSNVDETKAPIIQIT